MKLHEIEKEFRKGAAIKRKIWNHYIVYISKDSISLEDCLADDWECIDEKVKLQKQVDIYQQCCIDIINNHLKELGCDCKFTLVYRDNFK